MSKQSDARGKTPKISDEVSDRLANWFALVHVFDAEELPKARPFGRSCIASGWRMIGHSRRATCSGRRWQQARNSGSIRLGA